jgi:hypothetical protein
MVQSIQETLLARALNEKYSKNIILVFDKTHKLDTQQWLMKHHEHRPLIKVGLKMHFNMQT